MKISKWFLLLLFMPKIFASTIHIVAAENFYGQLASEIGGNNVHVISIISNPNADPHLFTTSAKTSISITNADIIIYNGNNYDDWMINLLNSKSNKTHIINVSQLVKTTTNPHIWYNPVTFRILAKNLANLFINLDPKNKQLYIENLNNFLLQNNIVQNKIATLKNNFATAKVTATEPVFGYMADAIGLDMLGLDVQWKIMNNTDPTPKMLINYQNLILNKTVRVLFYNNQVTDPVTQKIRNLAINNGIAVVGISETMPTGMTINSWLMAELDSTESALKKSGNIHK